MSGHETNSDRAALARGEIPAHIAAPAQKRPRWDEVLKPLPPEAAQALDDIESIDLFAPHPQSFDRWWETKGCEMAAQVYSAREISEAAWETVLRHQSGKKPMQEAQERIQRDMATKGTARVQDVFTILGDPSKGVTLPASEAMNELARKAVAMRDSRTEEEIIRDGVAFVMGPGGDEGTRARSEFQVWQWHPAAELPALSKHACSETVIATDGKRVAVRYYDFHDNEWRGERGLDGYLWEVTHWAPMPPMPDSQSVAGTKCTSRCDACGGIGTHRDDCPQWVHAIGRES